MLTEDEKFNQFLERLSRIGTLDCSYYRDNYLKRRVQARMDRVGAKTYDDYYALLVNKPDEYNALIDCIGTNVSEFFRDREVFELIRTSLLPDLIQQRRETGRHLRIWSCCCATGEEPYSLAMLVRETLGLELGEWDVKIAATDIDDEALQKAKKGLYKGHVMANIPRQYREKYFIKGANDTFQVKDEIRNMVSFMKLELISGMPISNIQLLLCRNMLIYIRHNLQSKIFDKFHFSLRTGGYLVIGKTETLPDGFGGRFEPVSGPDKIYRRT